MGRRRSIGRSTRFARGGRGVRPYTGWVCGQMAVLPLPPRFASAGQPKGLSLRGYRRFYTGAGWRFLFFTVLRCWDFLRAWRRILAIHSREYMVPRHLAEPQWHGAGSSSS